MTTPATGGGVIDSVREHEFTPTLSGSNELNTTVEDGLFTAGCDDGTLGIQGGGATVQFARSGASFADAVLSAIRDVRRAGAGPASGRTSSGSPARTPMSFGR